MREVTSRTGSGKFGQTIAVGPHTLVADEPLADGGADTGPKPHEFLLAALASCTSMTVKMYADRKGWPLETIEVAVSMEAAAGVTRLRRKITLNGPLDDEQRKRLLEIANKCPVHKTLLGKIEIE
ncbi:MAG: OsmC family protein [Polyangiales bacterium]